MKKWRTTNAAYFAEYLKDWLAANPGRLRQYQETQRLSKYDLTADEHAAMFKEQTGVCAITGQPPLKRALCIDHCHYSGSCAAPHPQREHEPRPARRHGRRTAHRPRDEAGGAPGEGQGRLQEARVARSASVSIILAYLRRCSCPVCTGVLPAARPANDDREFVVEAAS